MPTKEELTIELEAAKRNLTGLEVRKGVLQSKIDGHAKRLKELGVVNIEEALAKSDELAEEKEILLEGVATLLAEAKAKMEAINAE